MTDLRDRIAAALRAEDEKPHLCPFDGEPTMASYDRLADAVIAELGLRQAMRSQTPTGPIQTRYVTDWKADDA
jgi:hypothetical protein